MRAQKTQSNVSREESQHKNYRDTNNAFTARLKTGLKLTAFRIMGFVVITVGTLICLELISAILLGTGVVKASKGALISKFPAQIRMSYSELQANFPELYSSYSINSHYILL